jgi:S1-C subfamily serine protease
MRTGEPTGGLLAQGVPILKVLDGSPASVAGLRSGDVLCTIDDRWITSVADVYHAAAKIPPGRKISVLCKRDGKEVTVLITPSEGI